MALRFGVVAREVIARAVRERHARSLVASLVQGFSIPLNALCLLQ